MPTPVIVLAVLAVSVVAAAKIDLTRHDVRVLPKWAWGLIILVAFPFGLIAYLVLGRSRPEDDPPGASGECTCQSGPMLMSPSEPCCGPPGSRSPPS